MTAWLGALLGGAACLGVVLIRVATRGRPIGLSVMPLVSGDLARRTPVHAAVSGALLSRVRQSLMLVLDSLFGAQNARARLRQAGLGWSVERFRLDQLRWAAFGMASGVAIGLTRAVAGAAPSPVPWLAFVLLAGAAGACVAEQRLVRLASLRQRLIALELPTVAEMLAFTVAAGLAPGAALGRVAARSQGELGRELRRCCDDVAEGIPLAEAVRELGPRTGVASVARLAETLVIAMERGTPLSEVLRAQAIDARAGGHRALMESAGRREILALMPVVFMILPVVVVIAVFPGIHGLTMHVP